MKDRKLLLSVAATPLLQAILNIVGQLKLTPLAHWEWNESIALPITYIVSTGSAAVACLFTARKNRTKGILIACGMLTLLLSLYGYTWASTVPPKQGQLLFYDIVAYVSFFLTYMAFGFVVAHVVQFYAQRRASK